MPNVKPKKTELAKFKALNDLGLTPNAIGEKTGRDPKTVRKYLALEIYDSSEMKRMIQIIKERELDDLWLLGAKARKRLHELLDEGNTKAIETTAIMDRTFQQRRLIEGQFTEINAIQIAIDDIDKKIKSYEMELFEGEK
jgi:predicted transcriptional regulator